MAGELDESLMVGGTVKGNTVGAKLAEKGIKGTERKRTQGPQLDRPARFACPIAPDAGPRTVVRAIHR